MSLATSTTKVVVPTSAPATSSGAVAAAAASPNQTNPLLARYLAELAANPLRTKCITVGTMQFIQDILANHLAGVPARRVPKDAPLYSHLLARAKIDTKALKMVVYGVFVSAPLSHYMVGALQRAFAGRTGTRDKILQILASNLIVSPIQISVFLASSAIINGARSVDEVVRLWRRSFLSVMRMVWMTSPLSMVVAQKYLAPDLWVPWFTFIQFLAGTYLNTKAKLGYMAKKKQEEEEKRE